MVRIISEKGYPKTDEVVAIASYNINAFICEGGVLIVGRDSQGREYKPRTEPAVRSSYVLPSGEHYGVAIGSDQEKNHPAIHFPFQTDTRRWNQKILDVTLEEKDFDDEFFDNFDLTLMNEAMQRISLDRAVGRIFKEIIVFGVKNYFWIEMYCKRTPALEDFLENYRG